MISSLQLIRLAFGATALMATAAATAQISGDVVRVGFITDISGPLADNDGPGGLEAIRMAVADFGGQVAGKPIEVLSADHQNKADIAAAKAREWADREGVDMIVGGANSAAMLAINNLLPEKKFVFLVISAGATQFTNEACTPYTVQYAYNTTALARAVGSAIVNQGGKSWYFLTTDYAFGHSLEAETAKVVTETGGTVAGKVRHPLSNSDFSSFLLKAQASKAQVLGMANSGSDLLNSIKGAREFGLNKSMKLAGLVMFMNNMESIGLKTAQGLLMSEPWYWDQSDASRAFAQRYFAKMKRMPNSLQAADYSATWNYLQAVKAANSDNPDKVMEQLRKMQIDDMYAKGYIRADGQMIHDFYLYEVKKPEESKKPWDFLKQVAAIPGDKAFDPLSASTCNLLKK